MDNGRIMKELKELQEGVKNVSTTKPIDTQNLDDKNQAIATWSNSSFHKLLEVIGDQNLMSTLMQILIHIFYRPRSKKLSRLRYSVTILDTGKEKSSDQ